MKLINLDHAMIKQVSNASKTATGAMLVLAMRKRAHSVTTFKSIKDRLNELGEKPANRDLMDFWRGLEKAGAGALIVGRRGKQTRFEWNYSLKDVAEVAINNREGHIPRMEAKKVEAPTKVKSKNEFRNAIEIPKEIVEQVKAKSIQNFNAKKAERLIYTIEVRPGYCIEVALPVDISKSELEKVRNSFQPMEETCI